MSKKKTSRMERFSQKQQVILENVKRLLWSFFRGVLVCGICYIILYSLFLKLSISFKHKNDMFDPTVLWIPKNITLDNFRIAIDTMNYMEALVNSLSLSVLATILQIASCALAGYGFARLKFKGSGFLFGMVIFTIVIPPQTIMVPTYLHYRYFDVLGILGALGMPKGVNLLDSFWPFILSSATGMGLKNGLYIFIFRQFFKTMPREIEEASYVDGAGILKTFYSVILPNGIPAIVTVLLFSFVWQWNDSYFVTMYLTNVKVLSTQLSILVPTIATQYDPVYASMINNTGALLFMIPIVILYLFLQKYFVESVERTGIVG